MTEPSVRTPARSEGSGESGGGFIEGTVTCFECRAINPGGTQFCAECGTSLEYTLPQKGSGAAARLRREAEGALKRAHRWMAAVTLMYRLGAGAYALATMLAVAALARTDVPRGAGVLVVGLTTSLSVLLLMAAMHILFQPFVWTIAVACLATVVSIVHLVGPDPLGVAFLGSAAWAILAWTALVPAFRFRRLIATHKDRYALHHASSRTRHSLRGRSAHERHERLLGAMRRAARRTWKVSAAAAAAMVVASALGTYSVLASARPEEFAPVRARFEAAWNAADLAAVGELFDPKVRAVEAARLAGRVAGHGWGEAPPRLTGGAMREEGASAQVDYELGGVGMRVSWQRVEQRWSLVRVELPVPPLEPALEDFVQAWRDSDPKAIAALFAADVRAEMLASIESAVASRGWDSFPEVRSTEVSDDAGGKTTAVLRLEKGEVTAQWHFHPSGAWRLHGLRFPKR